MQQPARVGRSSNVAVQQLVGRWYIQERHNMEGAPLRRPALSCEHASRHLLALGPARPRFDRFDGRSVEDNKGRGVVYLPTELRGVRFPKRPYGS